MTVFCHVGIKRMKFRFFGADMALERNVSQQDPRSDLSGEYVKAIQAARSSDVVDKIYGESSKPKAPKRRPVVSPTSEEE